MATPQKKNGSRSNQPVRSSRVLSKDSVDTTAVPHNGEQRRMVSESAYFKAMSRNFDGGSPVEDWLEAEKEITTKLGASDACC